MTAGPLVLGSFNAEVNCGNVEYVVGEERKAPWALCRVRRERRLKSLPLSSVRSKKHKN